MDKRSIGEEKITKNSTDINIVYKDDNKIPHELLPESSHNTWAWDFEKTITVILEKDLDILKNGITILEKDIDRIKTWITELPLKDEKKIELTKKTMSKCEKILKDLKRKIK